VRRGGNKGDSYSKYTHQNGEFWAGEDHSTLGMESQGKREK